MAEEITVKATSRQDQGTARIRNLRRTGQVPGVVYSAGKPAESIQLNQHALSLLLRDHQNENMLMGLEVQGKPSRKVLLKDTQHHPLTGDVLHVDFYEVAMDKRLRISIPIELVGIPAGVSQQGGLLNHLLREIEVMCLPSDIVEHFDVDVTALTIGHHLTVADVPIDREKYKLLTPEGVAIASVSAPKEEEAKAAEATAGGAEPEVLKEKKPTEEEAAAAAKDGKKEPAKDAKKDEKKK